MFPASSTTPDAGPRIGGQTSTQQTNPQFVSNNGVVGTIAPSLKSFPSLTICEKFCTAPKRALGPALKVEVCDNKHPSTHQYTIRPCVHSGKCPQVASSMETLVALCATEKSQLHVFPTGCVDASVLGCMIRLRVRYCLTRKEPTRCKKTNVS